MAVIRLGGKRLRFGGNNMIYNFHPHTQLIIDRANQIGATLPSNMLKFDIYVRNMYPIWIEYHDVFYRFRGDGDTLFKSINLANPDWSLATPFGGLTWGSQGIVGNGTNGYINTNFNPSLLILGQKYQLNDASFGGVVFGDLSVRQYVTGTVSDTVNQMIAVERMGGNARINQAGSVNTPWPDFSGAGFKCLSRISNIQIESVNKDISEISSSNSVVILNQVQVINRVSSFFSPMSVSSYFMGKSIPYSVSQEIRAKENADMARLGLPQIA